jgi:prevent-host-death family protein
MRNTDNSAKPASVSIEEFRSRLADLMGRVMYGREAIVVTKYKQKAAVLISIAEYERLLDPTKRLTKRQWQTHARRLEAARRSVQEMDADELGVLVEKAVSEVRSGKRQTRA